MLHSCSFQGIPMGPQLPLYRRHHFSSCSNLGNGFGVRDCSSAICLSERYHTGGGRCGSYRSQSLQNLSGNRGNPLFGDYQDFGIRAVCGRSCGSFGVGNYDGANQCCGTHLRGYRGCCSGDSYHTSGLRGDGGSSRRMYHGGEGKGSAGGKNGGHSGESNGGGNGKTKNRQVLSETCQNNYVDPHARGRYSVGGRFGGHLGRRGSVGDVGQDRTQRVHTREGLRNPGQVETEPAIQRARMEEEQIKKLNRQCASCINKAHILQQQNTVLSTQWELLQQQRLERGSPQNTESLFQSYMQDMRMLLNTVQGEKGQLILELQQLKAVTEKYKERHNKELNQRTAAEDKFAALKKNIDAAYMENMDLAVKADLLIEQIVRLRGIYEVELTELQRRVQDGTNDIVGMDNHRDLNIDNFLEEVRCQYEEIVQRSKEEVDARYRGKYEELHIMCGMHYESLSLSHQEIQELTHHIRTLKMEMEKLKKKKTRVQETIADSKQRGDRAIQDAKGNLHDLQHNLRKAGDKLTRLLQDFQEQLNAKLALDTEVTICRKQLARRDYRLNQGDTDHTSASAGCDAERGAPSGIRNSRSSSDLRGSGSGNGASGMHYGSRSQGYSSRRGSYILGVTTCSGSRTYSSAGEGYSPKGTNSSTSREYDHKSMGTSASEVCSLAASGDGDSPGSGGDGSRDMSSVEEGVKSKTDSRNGGCAPRSLGGGLGDSEGGRKYRIGGPDSRNICSFGEGVRSPTTCESRGYNFGISAGRSRHGSGGNVGFGSGGCGSREEVDSGTNGRGYRGRPVYEGGMGESIQPPGYRNGGYGYENGRCTYTPGNGEFGSREISNSVGIVSSPEVSDRGRYTSGSRISPGRSRYGSGVEVGFGRGGYGSRDGPTCDNGRNDSVPPPEYGSCNEGERTSGNRELSSQGISGGGVSKSWSCETGGNGSGSGMCGSKGSGLTGATGGRGSPGREEYGFRTTSNLRSGVSNPEMHETRRHSFGTGISFRI